MKSNWKKLAVGIAVVGLGTLISCNRSGGTGHVQMRLMDAPSPYAYEAIYLDVQGVEVNLTQESGSDWISLHSSAGVYNLLSLVNGTDVLLVSEDVPEGRIEQVRLILGSGNTIVVNGVSYPLTIPSGSESGLKINVHENLAAGEVMAIMLDFDAAHSVEVTGNGEYKLKPVIHGYLAGQRGQVHGTVLVPSAGVAVIASNSAVSYSTYADAASGEFLIRGMMPGTYTVNVYLVNNPSPITYTNVAVTAGITTEVAP